jgi:hypothetical protein
MKSKSNPRDVSRRGALGGMLAAAAGAFGLIRRGRKGAPTDARAVPAGERKPKPPIWIGHL